MTRLTAFILALVAGCLPSFAQEKVTYFFDDFSSQEYTDYYWSKACVNQGHSTGRKYLLLGQASRAGSCTIDSGHMRFVTQPFDVRLPMGADFFKGSGGAEIGPISGRGVYDEFFGSGWDLTGQTYQSPNSPVGYEWDFRIVNLSLLQTEMVHRAAIGQFHSQDDPNGPCGAALVNSSPSPGLDVILVDPDHVKFTLYIKPIFKSIPSEISRWADRACSTEPDQPCQTVLWRGIYPLSDVLGQWMHISYVIQFAPDARGSIAFSFGRKLETAPPDEIYQPRVFLNGALKIDVPMTINRCPQKVFLGTYAQGYNELYYGSTGINGERAAGGPSWVKREFTDIYQRFIDGTQGLSERPPQIIVDYDNFRVFQP